MKYKLSSYVEVSDFEPVEVSKVPAKYLDGYCVLTHSAREKSWMINSGIRYFIEKFAVPRTQEEVLDIIRTELKADDATIRATCEPFFKVLASKKIIVPEETEEKVIDEEEEVYDEGDRLGRFTVKEFLSENKYLEVYLVSDEATGETMVIKLLNRKKTPTQKSFDHNLAQLEKEYRLQVSCNDIPSICKAYDWTVDQFGNPYMLIEYISGKGLSEFLDDNPAMPLSLYLEIAHGILEAFASLHRHKLIHGDIHASNIIVTDEQKVKIIDLGMSYKVTPENDEVLIFGGVNYYMPPERINVSSLSKFSKPPDFCSEVYQLGVILYKMLYNDLPFYGFIWEELASSIKEGKAEYRDMSYSNFPVPGELKQLIQKCMSVVPENRFKDASGILEAFNEMKVMKTQIAD
jgi:eukaryotic-like serine/threonine-protein kinase